MPDWLRPWALWGLLAALVLLAWGRRPGGSAVPRGVIDEALLPPCSACTR